MAAVSRAKKIHRMSQRYRWSLIALAVFAMGDAMASDGCQETKPFRQGGADPALVGHYYLGGVHEAGSELWLSADGSFQWALTYGALEQQARGKWHRQDERVILDVEPYGKLAQMFTPGGASYEHEPWGERSEESQLDNERFLEIAKVDRFCPFLNVQASPEYAASLADAGKGQADPEAAASLALAALRTAIHDVELAASEALAERTNEAGGPPGRDAMERANDAMEHYRAAEEDARQAYEDLQRDTSTLPKPVFPDICRKPDLHSDEKLPPSSWRGGHAVIVGDPRTGLLFSGISVSFDFEDGISVKEITDTGGWAGTRLRSSPLRAVELQLRDGEWPPEKFNVIAGENRVFIFQLDSLSLRPPPFERMELPIANGGLGRYRRNEKGCVDALEE